MLLLLLLLLLLLDYIKTLLLLSMPAEIQFSRYSLSLSLSLSLAKISFRTFSFYKRKDQTFYPRSVFRDTRQSTRTVGVKRVEPNVSIDETDRRVHLMEIAVYFRWRPRI